MMEGGDLALKLDLASSLVDQGHYGEAEVLCRFLSRLAPAHPVPFYLLGVIAFHREDVDGAETALREAIARNADVAGFHETLGRVLRRRDRHAEAAACFERALDLDPSDGVVHGQRAACLEALGDRPGGLVHHRRAAELAPGDGAVRLATGQSLLKSGHPEESLDHLRAAMAASPADPIPVILLARTLRDLSRPLEATETLRRFRLASGRTMCRVNEASWLLSAIPRSHGEMLADRRAYEEAIAALEHEDCPLVLDDLIMAGTNFFGAYQGVDDVEYQRRIARFYLRNCPDLAWEAPLLRQRTEGRVRVGFVSTNLFGHTVGKLFCGLIARLDRSRFEVTVFSDRDLEGEIGRIIGATADRFAVIPGDIRGAREMIAEAGLDLMFYPDIGMSSLTYFLAFSRLASVQCVGWGHPISTGIPTIDHFISSVDLETDDPVPAQSHYSEHLVRLKLLPAYLVAPAPPAEGSGPDLGFARGRRIYCCVQSLFKVHPDFDPLLRGILEGDPDGVVVFLSGTYPRWEGLLRERWRALGRDASERVFFLPRQSQGGFLGLVRSAHVILDTPCFCGGMTTFETLAVGGVVVTWPNTILMPSRVTAAYYRQIGVTDLIARDADDYVRLALRTARDADFRADVVGRIRAGMPRLEQRQDVPAMFEAFFLEALKA
ncbi:MAG: tetratricopeptide repeat protein [Alphaproteobacteria bacterium]